MTKINKQQSTLAHLCQTYGINVIGENSHEIFLSCLKPIKSIEALIKKLSGKKASWKTDTIFPDTNDLAIEETVLTIPALEKIISSLLNIALDSGATKIRLEPGNKDYRWRSYDRVGWHTLQYLPIITGKQICDYIALQNGLDKIHLPHHSSFKFNDREFKCSFQPVWQGTVVQLELIDNKSPQELDVLDFFNRPDFSNLILINQRQHKHYHSLPKQIEELSKRHDIITVGDKLGINEVVINFPNEEESTRALLEKRPEIVVINHHDLIGAINLAKTLLANKIKTILNLTSYSPWPILSYINNQKLNTNAIVVTMTGEKVCQQCKKNINPDARIECNKHVDHDDWLNKDVWENQSCDTTHKDLDYHVVIENWDGNMETAHKKIADHLDQLILNGELSWNNKNNFQNDKDNNYFNF